MSDDKLNEEINDDKELDKAELITDSPSSALEKVEEKKEGPKRRKKTSKKSKKDKNTEKEIDLSDEDKVEKVAEEIKEETESIKVETTKKDKKSNTEEHVKVNENEEAKIPNTMKQRYVDMLSEKNFEVRLKGSKIYDRSSKLKFELTDTGVKIDNKNYKYSEIVIRIKG